MNKEYWMPMPVSTQSDLPHPGMNRIRKGQRSNTVQKYFKKLEISDFIDKRGFLETRLKICI